jgi:putative phosphoribosyl transferase
MRTRFATRMAAGRLLADRLAAYRDAAPMVLGLPRGGVPVAAEVARVLGAPLDVFVVRKLGVPAQPELAFGAVATGGVRTLNSAILARAGLSPETVDRLTETATQEVERREQAYRGTGSALNLGDRVVILVDDGIATGATARAALAAIRVHRPAAVVLAAPVAPTEVVADLERLTEDVAVLVAAKRFVSVGSFYDDFSQLSDADVRAILRPGP